MKPNILILMSDQHTSHLMGNAGTGFVRTPPWTAWLPTAPRAIARIVHGRAADLQDAMLRHRALPDDGDQARGRGFRSPHNWHPELVVLRWTDDGRSFGPLLGAGRIGFRQMPP